MSQSVSLWVNLLSSRIQALDPHLSRGADEVITEILNRLWQKPLSASFGP